MAAVSDLSLRQLEYVVAVADTLGFRKAAERCHVSQPSLSAQIGQVEALLGVRLFERDKRRVLLTAAGVDLAERARRVLSEVNDLIDAAQRLSDPFSGTLRIGVIPTVAPYLLPEAIPRLGKRYPRLRLLIREDKTAKLVRDLRDGDLDAGILALESDLGDLAHAVIATDPFVLAAPPDHPSVRKKRVQAADLERAPVLLLDDGHCFRTQALALCTKTGAQVHDFRAGSLSTLAQMAAQGCGVTLLPSLAVPVENRAGQLAIREFTAPVPHRTVVLAWRPHSPLAGPLQDLATQLKQAWPRTAAQ
jgi:LysR family hydrogen peroxide-inducible transcriptional activator